MKPDYPGDGVGCSFNWARACTGLRIVFFGGQRCAISSTSSRKPFGVQG